MMKKTASLRKMLALMGLFLISFIIAFTYNNLVLFWQT